MEAEYSGPQPLEQLLDALTADRFAVLWPTVTDSLARCISMAKCILAWVLACRPPQHIAGLRVGAAMVLKRTKR